jgi:hypothetical protein
MSTSFSPDIANAKLMEIDREISITPVELIQGLSVASSNNEKILLVLAFLSSIEGKKVLADQIQKIKESFIMQKVTEANGLIREIITDPNNFIQEKSLPEWSDALEHLRESFSREVVYSANQENSPRRMFESILGQRYLASNSTLRDIKEYYESIDNAEQLSILTSKTLMEEQGKAYIKAWSFWEEHWQRISLTIDRGRDTPKEGDSLPPVRTPGVLKYTTPRPMYMYDREISFEGKTSQADKNRTRSSKYNPTWTQKNPETPFVASFSGHTIFFIGLLKAKSKEMPMNKRQHFFDTMLKSYIAVYLSQGFHSIKEMSDMITDTRILRSLKKAGIEVDLEKLFFGPDGVLDKTFADAIDYNKIYLLSKSVQEDTKETAHESNNDSDFVDPRETYLAEQAKQKDKELSEEVRTGGITTEEVQLREKLFSGDITPEQAIEQMPESDFILDIAISMNPEVTINTSKDRFLKKSSALNKEDKMKRVKQSLYKLQLASIKDDYAQINSLAITLFKSAGTVRNKLTPFRGDYSINTSSSKSLIKVLQQPGNANILRALNINPEDTPKKIEEELIEMMEKAYNNQDIISPEKQGLSSSHHLEEANFFAN